MNCHEFLEWTDGLTQADLFAMPTDLHDAVTMSISLAYMMVNTREVRNHLASVYRKVISQCSIGETESLEPVSVDLAVAAVY